MINLKIVSLAVIDTQDRTGTDMTVQNHVMFCWGNIQLSYWVLQEWEGGNL